MQKKFFFLIMLFGCLAFSSRAQMPIANIPDVYLDTTSNTPGIITGFEHDSVSKKLYIAGAFARVGNVRRQGFAVIDMTTGSVLNDLNFIDLYDVSNGIHTQSSLKIFKGRIYIGGLFDVNSIPFGGLNPGYLFSISLNGSANSMRNLCSSPISDFEIYNSKIYTSGAPYLNQLPEYAVNEMDTLGTISWTKSINTSTPYKLTSVLVKNNFLYVGGYFTSFGGVNLKNVAKVDLSTHTISTWQPSPLPGPSGSPACFVVNDLGQFANDLYLSIGAISCSAPSKNLIGYDLTSGIADANAQSMTYNGDGGEILPETDTSYWFEHGTSGLKIYGMKNYVSPWGPTANAGTNVFFRKVGYFFVGGSFTALEGVAHRGEGVYCLKPSTPVLTSNYTSGCQGQATSLYAVHPVHDATSYHWSYTGTGVTITGSLNFVHITLSNTATSGAFHVTATSYCGTTSDTLYVPFTVNIKPTVSAGPDIRFTCSHNIDTLKGTSTTPGVTYSWIGPGYSRTSPVNQVLNNISSGDYVFAVTTPQGCTSKDTAVVTYDTAAPVINHNLAHGMLTCTAHSVAMNAAALYPTSNLHWSGTNFSQSNPATVTQAGNYTLTITSNTNDCMTRDTFWVQSNTAVPNLSAPAALDTITCLHDSVLLSASSSTPNTLIYWKSTQDSLQNNSYTHISTAYVAHALDTTNGCSSQLVRPVAQYTTPPTVTIPPGNYDVNCSYSSVVLDGSTPNTGATLQWSGSNNFTAADPVTVSQAGTYVLTATNPKNGCTTKDSVEVTLQHVLVIHASPDTLICNGSSATLSASPLGGTPGFAYAWSNTTATASSVNVSPNDTTDYVVTITDNAGCVGSDTVRVFVPAVIGDSAKAFQPCDPNNPNGQIQAYGTGGIPPYSFAMSGGNFQSSGIFAGLNFGTYQLLIRDSLGCSTTFSAVIDSSSILPSPDFLLSTTEIKGDTFVLVDISNPRPDSVHWILPANCSVINSDPFAPHIIHADTGAFQITMMAWFGDCQMQITKNVTVIWPDTSFANSNNNNGIADLTLYPNPNTGQFTVDITLYKKQTLAIFIFDDIGNEVMRLPYAATDHVSANVQMTNAAPGSYVLKVIAEYDSRNRTFLISQH